MRIIKLFKNHVLALVCAVALIVISCNADLALPTYMSEIVDVGIQQGGIESPAPDTICAESLSDLELFMPEDDMATVEAAYSEPDAEGIRTYVGSEAGRAEDGAVSDAISLPETVVLSLEQGVDASSVADSMTGTLDMQTVRSACEAGIIPKEKLVEAASAMSDSMGSMGGSIVKQRAVTYVQQEYEAQGISLTDVQNSYLASMSLKMFGLCAVSLVATILTGAVASHTACTIARDLRRQTFDRVMHFSPAEVGKFSQASLITRCTNDIQQIQMATTLFIRMVLMAPIMGVVAVMRVLATHTGLEWAIGVAVIAVCAVVGVLMGLTMPKFKKMQKLVDRVNLVAREMLDGVMPIRAFGRQDHELGRFDDASRDLMDTQLFTNRAMSFMMPLMMLVMNCITVLIVWAGSHGVNDGVMQVGDMMAFISYTMQIVMAFMILTMVSVMLPRAEVAAERVEEVLSTQSSIKEPEHPQLPAADAPRGELVFKNVSFQYPDAREDVISGVSFTVHAGQTLGVIGSTGCGKSTLVQLIPRLYDVTGGKVTLDGIDVRDLSLSELRRRVGYVPQQGMLFSGTVESNLKFAGESVTDDAMREAAAIAQATGFIEEREGGFGSEISQGGGNISGGQRQRLSIARALAKRPEVVVFDDSFSALDYKTDARLREELERTQKEAAIVVVAQRIATIMHADQVIVLDDGQVVGQGTHEELLRSCPAYLEIAQSQLSAEELGLTQEEIAAVMEGGSR
ncbi:MAG: ABC transporter ATP-binding protein [Paratractidigestivibacter faecalis]|uniref:ABC transporter ATP-binding protein n=1 Tax=Paratractidigestivibacter faecalis TaxID=2292441 RepID=UPI002A9144B2|nr:ABC transporter ATP-binding protein [Paratractidigestivibacter faecalis]MDY6014452.1 ABC transporter ATP-binding protein [Paratractidigestivibacter faecalis]